MSNILRRFKNDISGLLWLASALFLSLSLASFHPQDPSFNTLGNRNIEVKNLCGYIGSFIADFIYQALGVCAWVVVFLLILKGYEKFRGIERKKTFGQHILSLFFVLSYSSLIALYAEGYKIYEGQIYLGGVIGELNTNLLIKGFNFIGVAIILWTACIALTVLQLQKPLNEFFVTPKEWLVRFFWFAIDLCRNKWEQLQIYRSLKREERRSERIPGSIKILEKKLLKADFRDNEDEDDEEDYDDDEEETEIDEEVVAKPKQISLFKKPKKRKLVLNRRVTRQIENWELPNIKMLEDPPENAAKIDPAEIRRKTQLLEDKLKQFSVNGKVVGVMPGPAVTMFEYKPNADVKISKITDLADDLSLALSAESVRIIAPIPGRDVVGIETSNSTRETVYLKEILADDDFWSDDKALPLALGKQANGNPNIVDLRKMPHLLVAGSTGSGKSVFVVSCLTGLLFKHSPKTLRLIVIDPKQVDLAAFHKVPHLLMPPICEVKKAVAALKWAVKEMEKRYRSMSKFGARNIEEFNEKVKDFSKEDLEKYAEENEALFDNKRVHDTFHYEPQPYTVIVVEEFADLMTVDKGNVEALVVRLAQMARASGMHLILAMQSPRKDVVTGLIKTNIPGRISFKVASKMDSRIILDEGGAERLLARGDMLYSAPGVVKPQRHHGAWLTEDEITSVMDYWAKQSEPNFDESAMRMLEGSGGGFSLDGTVDDEDAMSPEQEERYDEILAWVSTQKTVSASLLQRKFRLGYPRAARMIEMFEAEGVVGPPNGSKPRDVLVSAMPEA